MRKYSFILVALCAFLGSVGFTSCNNNDEEYLQGQSIGTTVNGGQTRTNSTTVSYNYSVNGGNGGAIE